MILRLQNLQEQMADVSCVEMMYCKGHRILWYVIP